MINKLPPLFGVVAICATLTVFCRTGMANHRTGALALPELMTAGDFNQDGKLDLAVNLTGFDNITILFGDGSGNLTLNGHVASDTLTKGLTAVDVNGDGQLDLVGATAWGYDVIVHLGDGRGGFGHRDQVLNGEGEPTRVLAGDFNNDTKPDLAVNAPDEGKMLIYLNDGQGGFILPAIELTNLPRCFGIGSGDFNSDGKQDLVASTFPAPNSDGKVVVLIGDGKGGFTPGYTAAVSPLPTSVATGDLNNDGKLDIVVAGAEPHNMTGNFFTCFLGDGRGQFTQKQTTKLGKGSLKGTICLGDFNEDGNLDLAFPFTGSQIAHMPSHIVLIYFGDGAGTLTAGPILEVGNEPHSVIAADFNHDRHLDLAVSNRSDGTVSLLLGDGAGGFTTSATVSVVCLGGVCD